MPPMYGGAGSEIPAAPDSPVANQPERKSFGSRLKTVLPAAVGLGAAAFGKGALSDFGAGLASGYSGEKYRQFRETESQKTQMYLSEVEGLRNRIMDLEKNNFYDSPELQQAAELFHTAMEDGKLSPKEKSDIQNMIDRGMASKPHEAQKARQETEGFKRQAELLRTKATEDYEAKKKTGELVPYQGPDDKTYYIDPASAAGLNQQLEVLRREFDHDRDKQKYQRGTAALLQSAAEISAYRNLQMTIASQLAGQGAQLQMMAPYLKQAGMGDIKVPSMAFPEALRSVQDATSSFAPKGTPGPARLPGPAGPPVPPVDPNDPYAAAAKRREQNSLKATPPPGSTALPPSPDAKPTPKPNMGASAGAVQPSDLEFERRQQVLSGPASVEKAGLRFKTEAVDPVVSKMQELLDQLRLRR